MTAQVNIKELNERIERESAFVDTLSMPASNMYVSPAAERPGCMNTP